MENNFRKKYYPDGITAEERLFTTGASCTRIPLSAWTKALVTGLSISLIGAGILAIDYSEFAIFLCGLGSLAALIGIGGITVYNWGLNCLEKAELLYNTRKAAEAHGCEADTPEEAPAPQPEHKTPSTTAPTPNNDGHGTCNYVCGNCNTPGPFDGACPQCGSSIRFFKHH